ncbi:hypothetical protein G6F46_008745 [Rhizopus delemar]|uniref:Uncharacterized protein n=3 Tax=Rhizopus TaxID=4842 RepID=I1CBN3_RHIO9|nr:hypothetical protein RO3G_10573 [Rhizopus delemar RA 99-880]KAG1178517.1 hypothetical protein G6F36_010669 [Rhizopus arrhizus]KAG1454295.1 hypothetical protein G6F55_007688 [Rhizopus delemar]KAG1498108.1 hypothetical protein G6F54_005311 [Rhizopus delemar]KAG1507950.1 hypothetical protein G6F53_008558 [Rhizopus delemar]|eukprot:EIE85863.1 hypothetical protein RO3G_10573 [Rhizopus delemar RA 99-880]
MNTEISEEYNSKSDGTPIAKDYDEFQEVVSTLDSVDKENIDSSKLPTQIDEDSNQKKMNRKEAIKK